MSSPACELWKFPDQPINSSCNLVKIASENPKNWNLTTFCSVSSCNASFDVFASITECQTSNGLLNRDYACNKKAVCKLIMLSAIDKGDYGTCNKSIEYLTNNDLPNWIDACSTPACNAVLAQIASYSTCNVTSGLANTIYSCPKSDTSSNNTSVYIGVNCAVVLLLAVVITWIMLKNKKKNKATGSTGREDLISARHP